MAGPAPTDFEFTTTPGAGPVNCCACLSADEFAEIFRDDRKFARLVVPPMYLLGEALVRLVGHKYKLVARAIRGDGDAGRWETGPITCDLRLSHDVIACPLGSVLVRIVEDRKELPRVVCRINVTAIGALHVRDVTQRQANAEPLCGTLDEGAVNGKRHRRLTVTSTQNVRLRPP